VQDSQTKKLEGQIRRLKIGFAICLVFSVLPWVMGQAAVPKTDSERVIKKVVKAERFILVDSKHKIRAILSMITGEPTLSFADAKGNLRAYLGLTKKGATLSFLNSAGEIIVDLSTAMEKDKPFSNLSFSDASGGSVELYAGEAASTLVLGDKRLALMADDKAAVILVNDKYGNGRVLIGESEGTSKVSLLRADGTILFHAP
jgi:hypothetical protein